MVRSVLCSIILLSCLPAGTASAAPVRYAISGSTSLAAERLEVRVGEDGSTQIVETGVFTTDGLRNVPVTGEAVLDFDGSRVTLERFDISFEGVAIIGVIAVDAAIGVAGGAGDLIGNVLRFDEDSLLQVSFLGCESPFAALCDAIAPPGVRDLGALLLNDFVFDFDGNFTTAQAFPGAIPIGVSAMPGLGGMATGQVRGGLALRAVRVVPEPSPLGLSVAALTLFAVMSTRRRRVLPDAI